MTRSRNGVFLAGLLRNWARLMRVALCAVLLGCGLGLCVALPAHAEESADLARAGRLFTEGRSLAAQGRYEDACARFENSLNLVYAVGTMFNLADCWEKVGRTGSALLMFRRVAATAEATGQEERGRVAAERARALEPNVAKMKIRVAGPPKIEVTRNDQVVRNEEYGAPVPVDPGTYRVAASSPGKKPWSSEVIVQDTAGLVVVTVPELEGEKRDARAGSAEAARPAADAGALRPPAAPARAPPTEGSSRLKRLALVLGGVGGGALTAGAAFAFQYKSSNDDARALCQGTHGCSAEEIEQHAGFVDDARRARTLCYVGFGVGAAAITSAAIIYFSSRGASAPRLEASAGLSPNGSWSAGLGGKF